MPLTYILSNIEQKVSLQLYKPSHTEFLGWFVTSLIPPIITFDVVSILITWIGYASNWLLATRLKKDNV